MLLRKQIIQFHRINISISCFRTQIFTEKWQRQFFDRISTLQRPVSEIYHANRELQLRHLRQTTVCEGISSNLLNRIINDQGIQLRAIECRCSDFHQILWHYKVCDRSVFKRMVINTHQLTLIGDIYFSETITAIEGVRPNLLHAIRDPDGFQLAAVIESTFINSAKLASLRYIYRFQTAAIRKGIPVNALQSCRDTDLLQLLTVHERTVTDRT